MKIECPEFSEGETIPTRFTCSGDDVSPELRWSGVPEGTAELLLIVEDPDAPGGVWTHWVLSGLDASTTGLAEGEVPAGAVEGINGFDGVGWGGPCPPVGHGPHRYYFRLYAVSEALRLTQGGTADEARAAAQGKILAEAGYMGRFERSSA